MVPAPLAAITLVALSSSGTAPRPERHELRSPDGLTVVTVELGDAVRWSVSHRGREVLLPSTVGLESTAVPRWAARRRRAG